MDEITAEYATNQLVELPELRAVGRVSVAAKTDLGRVRENNEDKFEFYIPEDSALLATRGQVFVVCDGMGGHAAGQIASELASKTFIDVYLNHPATDVIAALNAAVVAANRFVVDVGRSVPSRRGMGTTLTALVLVQDEVFVAQVGDSRAYRIRKGVMDQLTCDHTYIEEMVRNGVMSRQDAEGHPQRHMLTRAVGAEEGIKPDIFKYDLKENDLFLLCSDGLLNHVEDEGIQAILESNSPAPAAWKLVGQALIGGGSDNVTVMVVRVDKIDNLLGQGEAKESNE